MLQPMSLIPKDLIYRTVILCLRLSQPEFFRRIQIEGVPLDDPQQHLLVVANHPYGIQDAFLISYAYTRPFFFVATALNFQQRRGNTIRKRRLRGWFLKQCKVLPIVRDRSEGHMSDNLKTIELAAQHIASGHALGIFAEGDSRGNQWGLLKLKSGAAQIALQVADLLKQFDKRLKIQVVGLTYTNWEQPFKSSVTLRFAQPFVVDPVNMDDRPAVRSGRRMITARLTELMEETTVQIAEPYRALAGKIARFYTVHQRSDFERLKAVGQHVERLAQRFAGDRPELEQKLDEYLQLADELKIYPGEERRRRSARKLLLAALPAYVGWLLHTPILWATRALVPRQTTPLHSLGDKRLMGGIALTLVWYSLIFAGCLLMCLPSYGLRAFPLALAVIVVIASCGLIANHTFRHVNFLLRSSLPSRRRFRRYRQLGAELFQKLEGYRREFTAAKATA